MKVAIYTIALNEGNFVERWYESAKEADYLLIADTGSTDNTKQIAEKLGINVYSIKVSPWRFDIARNASLALLPEDIDYCIALDMDEIILPGWREELEKVHKENVTRPRYKYTWSWNSDGSPGLTYSGDKIHTRNGYRWKHPVHEVLITDRISQIESFTKLEIHHHPDNTKSRGQYLPLLKLAVDEDPNDDRNTFYYARELFFHSQKEVAAEEFKRHLSLPRATWKPERAASMRYIGKCLTDEAEYWFRKAVEECPGRREPLLDLAKYYYENSNWENSLLYAEKALEIQEKPLEYLCEADAWAEAPWDYAAIAAYNLELYEKAFKYSKKALEINPTDQRLIKNFIFCQKSYEES